MPKETRKKSTRDACVPGLPEGSRPERRNCEQHAPSLSIPQVTVHPGHGSSLALPPEDWGPSADGTLHRSHSSASISSTGSSALESEDELHSDGESRSRGIVTLEQCEVRQWSKLKTFVHWPFRSSLKRRVSWVQLAGHKGSFKSAEGGTVLKKLCENERLCFEGLQEDTLLPFVPRYHGAVERDGQRFLHMDDLLLPFDRPNVMDCKMGVRTYLEEELVRARERPRPREDLYKKMVEVDGEGPTAEEHSQRAVTKPRYMQWRETLSSTHTLGFRVEGVKKRDGTCRTDFKKTRSQQDIVQVFQDFVGGSADVMTYRDSAGPEPIPLFQATRGDRQLSALPPRRVGQGAGLDDRLWQDHGSGGRTAAARRALAGGEPRGRVPVGSAEPHLHPGGGERVLQPNPPGPDRTRVSHEPPITLQSYSLEEEKL